MPIYYRYTSKNKGIYEQVDIECPKNSPLRANKPDGSWLAKIGPAYPGAISYFTEAGKKKYIESGLAAWHASVVTGEVQERQITDPESILYEDEYQVIVAH